MHAIAKKHAKWCSNGLLTTAEAIAKAATSMTTKLLGNDQLMEVVELVQEMA
jgi:hypothetical protein